MGKIKANRKPFFRKKNMPQNEMKTSRLRDPAFRKKLYRWALVLALLALAVYALVEVCDNSHFVVTFYEVEDEKIENHMRIAVLADLHLKEFGKDNSELVEEIIKLKPDIIAMAGDMLDMNKTDYSVLLTLCTICI